MTKKEDWMNLGQDILVNGDRGKIISLEESSLDEANIFVHRIHCYLNDENTSIWCDPKVVNKLIVPNKMQFILVDK
jgi:hypothetical protein